MYKGRLQTPHSLFFIPIISTQSLASHLSLLAVNRFTANPVTNFRQAKMQYSLKLAAVALLGLASAVNALPGNKGHKTTTTNGGSPPGYGSTTSSTTGGATTPATSSKSTWTSSTCSQTTETSTSVGQKTYTTVKETTVWVTATKTSPYTTYDLHRPRSFSLLYQSLTCP